MFNSSFAREMTDYLELRTAVLSASSASNDRRVLLLLDQYLVLSGFQGKELTEDILSAWSKNAFRKKQNGKRKTGSSAWLWKISEYTRAPVFPANAP